MRFKKLKISVGIALILFILILGNIYAFGFMKADDIHNSDIKTISPPVYTDKSPAIIQPQTNAQSQPATVQPAIAQPQPTIVHQTVVTRAS